jgi:murein DD-endopeptidase MepM/ murein hydrolase activator NlpD
LEKAFDFRHNKKLKIMIVLIIVAAISLIGMAFTKSAYAVMVDGETICIIENKEEVEQVLQDIKADMGNTLKKDVIINQEISIEKTNNPNGKKINTLEELKTKIQDAIKIRVEAYAINVNGKDIAYLNNEKEAKDILTQLKEKYKFNEEHKEYREVDFVEDIKVLKKATSINQIKRKVEVYDYILLGRDEVKTYKVKDGDTVWDIMTEYELTLEEMEEVNPDEDLDKIKIGQELIVMAAEPLINVRTIETTTYQENIPFEVQYEGSETLYEGESKVKIQGVEGKKKIYVEIERVNGIQEKENILKEEVLEEARTKVVIRGTKERPKTMATGKFATPARGRFTSGFGSRWGRRHDGIDLAMPIGTPVKAADGGRVTFSGTNGAYGKLVIINHENGYETRYAHNSSLKVKVGQRVYKGQVISKSGNTGRSTGPHLHFEVRKNGVPINPIKYINL